MYTHLSLRDIFFTSLMVLSLLFGAAVFTADAQTCYDDFGDVIPCDTSGGGGSGTCYDDFGNVIFCDTSGGGGSGSGSAGGLTLFDPIDKSIEDIFRAILDIIMVFAIPIILFFIVWAGFLYVTAGGKEEQISKATKALTYAVVGGVIVLGAKLLLEVITNTIALFA